MRWKALIFGVALIVIDLTIAVLRNLDDSASGKWVAMIWAFCAGGVFGLMVTLFMRERGAA